MAITQAQIARAARMYKSNQDAGRALGIAPNNFARLCRQYGVETPQARRQLKKAK